jgi:hypothetical protein
MMQVFKVAMAMGKCLATLTHEAGVREQTYAALLSEVNKSIYSDFKFAKSVL